MEFLFALLFFGFLFKFFFWILLIGGLVFFLRGGRLPKRELRRYFQDWKGEDQATRILRQRFANGEISLEEYENLKRSLA